MNVTVAAKETRALPTEMSLHMRRAMLVLYTVTVFLTSSLLFLVQPMVGKILLPRLGGSPAVWNTAMVFFQVMLLLGYAWAHLSLSWLRLRTHTVATMGLFGLTLLTLPVALPTDWIPTSVPALWVLLALLLLIGGPFVVLASMSPTLQRWLSLSRHPHGADPYFLYAASNAGSLLGLLAYPLLVEPAFDTSTQAGMWSWLYGTAAVAVAACGIFAVRFRKTTGDSITETAPHDTTGFRWRWIALSAVPAALLLAVTHHITTDIAAVPLLWVIPLSLYLATFIVAFGPNPRWLQHGSAIALKLLVVALAVTFIAGTPLAVSLIVNLATFTAAALLLHSLLADSRPAASGLTRFYLTVSVGGALGGTLTALIAPLVLPVVLEYPVAVALALALIPTATTGMGGSVLSRIGVVAASSIALIVAVGVLGDLGPDARNGVIIGIILIAAYVVAATPRQYATVAGVILVGLTLVPLRTALVADRGFFGVVRVEQTAEQTTLWSGSTVHGVQLRDATLTGLPTSYYHSSGPLGDVMAMSAAAPRRIAVIGLGAATIAAYGHDGDHITFYEIDPTMARIASDAALFTFLRDTAATYEIALGDGRLLLEQDDTRYDVIVIDAFSSDAIPTHLITTEAMELYAQHLTEDGVIAYHVSNRHLDLTPIVARQAESLGMAAAARLDLSGDAIAAAQGKKASSWVAVAPARESLQDLARLEDWTSPQVDEHTALWTDSFSNLISALR
jgi:hypothetical protein